jgi:hypothetical protein
VGGERATAPHFGGIFYWIAFTSSGTPDNRPLSGRSHKFSVKYRNDAGFYKELSAARTLFFGKGPGGGLSRHRPAGDLRSATHPCRLASWLLLEIGRRCADRPSHPMPPESNVPPDHSNSTDDDHRVVPFRPRGGGPRRDGWSWHTRPPQPPAPPVPDLGKYEGGDYDDNYRHRMMVNLAALGFTAVLAVVGVWLVIQLADLRKNQDCVLSGRRNCAPIDVNAQER